MTCAGKALVVDDEDAIRQVVVQILADDGWDVAQSATGSNVPGLVQQTHFDLLVLDQKLPDADGVELLQTLRDDGFNGAAVIITGYPTVRKATTALGSAATDYLQKPFDTDRLRAVARQVLKGGVSRRPWKFLWETIEKRYGFRNVLSRDPDARRCYITAARVADSVASVLIEGETGTGKEYLARAVHYMSGRCEGPFVAVNCGAIPDSLLESEMFGHEKGAFTSATALKKGICEMAHGGTLFLDEISELTPAAQVKLLRFLQERTITRLGGLKPIEVDVRVIGATNRDLVQGMRDNSFREDLYYRLSVVPLRLPPLRERQGDVVLFARHFLREVRREMGRGPTEYSPEALAVLKAHDWSGNLRELHNVVQRSALIAPGNVVKAQHIEIVPRGATAQEDETEMQPLVSLEEAGRMYIRRVLTHTNNNKSEASRILGISRQTLRAKIAEHGLAV